MSKELKLLRSELRKAKRKIKLLEKTLGRNKPTFFGFDSKTATINGHERFVKFEDER